MGKAREGPKVNINVECRGCKYLDMWAGMCDIHFRCEKKAWSGTNSQSQGSAIVPPKKCPFRDKAIKDFMQALKGGE